MKPGRGKKVLVAMSGGVDSSVAAALLKDEGYSVVGCFMRLGSEEEEGVQGPKSKVQGEEANAQCRNPDLGHGTLDVGRRPRAHHQGCCSVDDAADARLVAAMLDVPFYVLNFRKDFGRIIDYFVREYNAGRTPNPCVRCNDWLKFGKLADYAKSIDADYVATGHYARVEHASSSPSPVQAGGFHAPGSSSSRARLLRGLDHRKDQSYVLFGTNRDALAHMLLPIGALEKPAVRRLAEEFKLPVFNKPDSQEICFVPDNDYGRLVAQKSPDRVKPGDIVDREGHVLGQHDGQQRFTIGQRRGLGVSAMLPLYVINRDAATNTVTVGGKDDLMSTSLTAAETNWLIEPPAEPRRCTIKIRYNSPPVPGHVRATGPDSLEVHFDEPQSAVTPGQAVVCYDGEELIGGGWIGEAF